MILFFRGMWIGDNFFFFLVGGEKKRATRVLVSGMKVFSGFSVDVEDCGLVVGGSVFGGCGWEGKRRVSLG